MTEPPAVLELAHVEKRFGGLRAVHDLSFDIAAGERVALAGMNGAGKTTVFDLISGLHPVDGGRIRLHGDDITSLSPRQRIRRGLGRTFQRVKLIAHLTVLEHVMIGQGARYSPLAGMLQPVRLPGNRWRRDALEALEQAGLGSWAASACGTIPYGIQKRVEIVRALVARPRVLLLDEPAAGLDPAGTEAMQAQLEAIAGSGVTLLLAERDLAFVSALCQRVIVMESGCRIADCPPLEAQADPGVREIYPDSGAAAGPHETDDEPGPAKLRRRRAARSR